MRRSDKGEAALGKGDLQDGKGPTQPTEGGASGSQSSTRSLVTTRARRLEKPPTRSHGVYYIEKRGGKKRFPKPFFQDLKNRERGLPDVSCFTY